MSDAIRIRGVSKSFGPKVAVKDLELTVPQGVLYAFIGPNGAGKTTTIRMIMSILFPDRGEISVLGKASAVDSKDRIGYLPEERGVYRKMKVGAFLTYMARLKGVDSAVSTVKAKEWLERMGLGDCWKKKCEELSKGMQQKVQFISAVIHEPDLIILDEVFSGLDPVNRRLIRHLIHEQHQAGRTIIFSTHAMFEAEQLGERVFMIHRGVKVLDDTIDNVWAQWDPRTVVAEPLDGDDPAAGPDDGVWNSVRGVREVVRTKRGVELRIAPDSDAATVMAEAARIGRLRRIEIKRPNLEDIFIELVGGSAEALRAELGEDEPVGASGGGAESGGGES